jgi:hypothetical protein
VIRHIPYDPASKARTTAFRRPEWGQLQPSDVWQHLSHLEERYPNFRSWYYDKVIPGVFEGERCLLACVSDANLLGVAIGKRSGEQKLCTLWVIPAARAIGVADILAQRAFEWIGADRPLFTVPEEQLPFFRGLLSRWNFAHTQKIAGYYRQGKIEHIFNGHLVPEQIS